MQIYAAQWNDSVLLESQAGCNVFVCSEESYVVFDYATLENVEVEEEEEQAGKLYLRLKPNSEGRCEQMALVAESK